MKVTGGIVNRCDIEYSDARLNYNRAINKFPYKVIFCFKDEDVINAIKYVTHYNLKFRIRSGRHDFEANSNINKGIIIDISNINYVKINKCNNTAKIGAGVVSGKMYEVLVDKNYTIPSGTCAEVGFCGLTTCGGVGFAARYLGLSCDNLLEVEMIDYKGQKIISNKYENKDLFWALRGGLGANFGVITSLTYKLTPVSIASTYVITWDYCDFIEVFNEWQSTTPYLDNRLSTNFILKKDEYDKITVSSSGQFFGQKEELEVLIKGLLEIATPISIEINEGTYLDAIKKWSYNCFSPNKYKSTGSFIYKQIESDNLEFIKNVINKAPKGSNSFLEFIGLNGRVSYISSNETAFAHRKALYLTQIKSIFTEEGKYISQEWVESTKNKFDTFGVGTYRGFTDFDICNWQYQYYGENYNRLQTIKKTYDPYNIFCFKQSIQLPY